MKNQLRLSKCSLCFQVLLIFLMVSCKDSNSIGGNSKARSDSDKTISGRDSARVKWEKDLEEYAEKSSEDSIPLLVVSVAPNLEGVFNEKLKLYQIDILPDTAVVQYIDENSLLEINISSAQIEKLGNELGEDDLNEVAIDNQYYMAQVVDSIKELGVTVVQASERYLQFRGLGNNKVLIDLEKNSLPGLKWTFIAFNKSREPKLINSTVGTNYAGVTYYIKKDIVPSIFLEDSVFWNLPTKMMEKDSITDEEFWQFLLDYQEAARGLGGENLWYHPEYASYDQYHSDSDESSPLRIILEREARKLGFLLKSGAGDSYFGQSARFIKDYLYDKTSQEMQEFLNLFLVYYEDGYWDEGPIISPDEVARMLILWDEFDQKFPEFIVVDYAKNEVSDLERMLIQDDDLYVHFDENGLLLPEFRSALEYVIDNSIDSRGNQAIKEFYELLLSQDFKKTLPVTEYLKDY